VVYRGNPARAAQAARRGRRPKAYEVAGRFDLNWRGLARYWRKKAVGATG
jgi:hypothetical protein